MSSAMPPAPKQEVSKIGVGSISPPKAEITKIGVGSKPSTIEAKAPLLTQSKAAAVPSKNDHPDAAYLKSEEIGVVIAKGMAVMYKSRPKNPVDFLAKWLLNYTNVQKSAAAVVSGQDKVNEEKSKREYELKKVQKVQAAK
jgi:hypothetical protein